ncbi:trehalose-phosphatase [uncultured Jannaschia sp.]|uniref:trehalose-phosphatase n=1 Tax=uncultured Jannaschia sp. TaxID=293347 RepID=UPI0026234A8A|nr:trehalose-phosphatase [uncultured Jannaschia sp.]
MLIEHAPDRGGSTDRATFLSMDRIAALDAVIFDLDGVVTRTARLHQAAWNVLFEEHLAPRTDARVKPFMDTDYRRFVDGKPRYEGVRSFLASRGIALPYGDPADPPDRLTICGLGNRKNLVFNDLLAERGVEVFEGSVAFIRSLRERGVRTALVSASRNAVSVLEAAALTDLFEVVVDGVEAARLGLPGKPGPDTFLEAARRLGIPPDRAAVVEDAIAGVAAGRAGGFALVIGVAQAGDDAALREAGADLVVGDLSELEPPPASSGLPDAGERIGEIAARLAGKRAAVFLDYDGTLTPMVDRPERAVLSDAMRDVLRRLAEVSTLAIVSGRDRVDVARLVGIGSLIYAGSHGFDITGPDGLAQENERAAEALPALAAAADRLDAALEGIEGAQVERKKFAIAVHYRRVAEGEVDALRRAVEAVAAEHPELRQTGGKMILELRPRVDWDKGRAVLWLLEALGMGDDDVLPLYLGDDDTDEDAFAALAGRGIGILVSDTKRQTAAQYVLTDTDAAGAFLHDLASVLDGGAR